MDFQFENYKLLRAASYSKVTRVSYNRLIELIENLSSDFFGKFPSIRILEATGELDRFEWFVTSVRGLDKLILTNTLLGQTFLDNLPDIKDRLLCLRIVAEFKPNLNFDFTLRFQKLFCFKTNQQFEGSFDLATKAFHQPKYLRLFLFREGDKLVRIQAHQYFADNFHLSLYKVKKRDNESDEDKEAFKKRINFRKGDLKWL